MFQSTLPTRGSDLSTAVRCPTLGVSIHAPHEGERPKHITYACAYNILFQSTLPTRGSDAAALGTRNYHRCFNPRSPRGGATLAFTTFCSGIKRFNPRSPRGGATGHLAACLYRAGVSIHAPHEGERRLNDRIKELRILFQSTLPTRGSDEIYQAAELHLRVSIHAPHEGERLFL